MNGDPATDWLDSPLPKLPLADAVHHLFQTKPGTIATLIGVEARAVRDAAPMDVPRTALLLDLNGAATAESMVGRILDDLAAILVRLWPAWQDRASADQTLSKPWLRAAVKRAASGMPPRFRRLPVAVECRHLLRVVDPYGPILIVSLDCLRAERAAPMIQALEWCAGLGAAVAVVCPARPRAVPPYDRVLYGAVDVLRSVEPLDDRLVLPRGKAHPKSSIERRVESALRADAELGGLFIGNRTITTGAMGVNPCVDFLWEAGRIVVELDGPEHRGSWHYGQDRHRDYELLVAGYLVLRLTNEEVEVDLQRTIGKIRDVVRFRRSLGKGILA